MGQLTTEEGLFLRKHKIPMSMMFDASGLENWQLKIGDGQYFAFCTKPCKSDHRLRTRSNNCIQCNTAYISFQLRNTKPATVYVAASRARELFKVGSTTELDRREKMLKQVSYGGADDWFTVAKVYCKHAGKIEFTIHDKLRSYQHPASYIDAGREIEAYEVFACAYSTVRAALIASIPEDERTGIWYHPHAKDLCNFPSRPGRTL